MASTQIRGSQQVIDTTVPLTKLADLGAAGHIIVADTTSGHPRPVSVAMSGEATIVSAGTVTLSNAAVIGKVLTGFTSGSGAVTSSDSILAAIQHLDGNVGLKVAKAGDTMTGSLLLPNGTTALPALAFANKTAMGLFFIQFWE